MLKYIVFALLVVATFQLNTNPYIGIWTQPSSYADDGFPADKYSYMAASYVKYLEMAGARVVPILYDGDKEYYDNLLNTLNGALFTGGDSDINKGTTLGDNAQYFFNKVKEMNDNGNYFPLWGTCMGFQLLVNLSDDLKDTLTAISDESNVNRVIDIQQQGTLYASMPQQLQDIAETKNIQFYNHHWCVSQQTYNKNSNINSFYRALATAQNGEGDVFITTIESYQYPIWGVQFHPEKASFEWKVPANHTIQAVQNSQFYADFFVQKCRLNNNSFPSQEEADKAVIYNYSPYSFSDSSFEQVYMFENLSNNNIITVSKDGQQEQHSEGKQQVVASSNEFYKEINQNLRKIVEKYQEVIADYI